MNDSISEFKIDTNAKMPELKTRRRYPWAEMTEVGYSFFVPNGKINVISSCAAQASRLIEAPRRGGWKFSCRAVEENGVKGVRVWRIK